MERYSEPSQIIPFFRLLLKKAVCGPDYEYSIFFDKQLSKKNRPFPKHRPRCWSCDRRWYPDCCMIVHAARYFPSQLPRGVAGVVSSRGRPCGALRMNAQGGAAGGDARAALTDRALRSPQLARWLLARPAPSTDVPSAPAESTDAVLLRLVRVGWVLEQKPHGCAAVSILLRGGHESSGTLVGRRSAGHQ
jgi:hypothetical protein